MAQGQVSCDRRPSFLPMNLAYPGCLATVVCSVRVHPTLAGRPVRRADANHRSLPTVHEQTATHAGSSKIHWHTAPGGHVTNPRNADRHTRIPPVKIPRPRSQLRTEDNPVSPDNRYASEAQGTINTREVGCCLSGNIPLRGGFAPIHALCVALFGA